jgi:hypothetical protein
MAIAGIFLAVMTTMIGNMQRETTALTEKLSALDLQKTAIAALADGSVCKFVMTSATFDATQTPTAIAPIKIPVPNNILYHSVTGTTPGPILAQANQPASALTDTLRVADMHLELTSKTGTAFTGEFVINFNNAKTVRPVRPVRVMMRVTASAEAAGATVASCAGSGGGGSGGTGGSGEWCGAFPTSNGGFEVHLAKKCQGMTPVCSQPAPPPLLGCQGYDLNSFCPSGYTLQKVFESPEYVPGSQPGTGDAYPAIMRALHTCMPN